MLGWLADIFWPTPVAGDVTGKADGAWQTPDPGSITAKVNDLRQIGDNEIVEVKWDRNGDITHWRPIGGDWKPVEPTP